MTKSIREVVVSETTQFLEEERERCAKLSAKLEREQKLLRKARCEWAPNYEQWYAEEVAPLACRARELMLQVRDQRAFLNQVELAAIYLHRQPAQAAPVVRRALRGHVIFEELEFEYYETGQFPRGPLCPDVDAYLRLRFARERYPKLDPANFEREFEEFKRILLEDQFGHLSEPIPSPSDDARLKRLYRDLARRLHPDSNPNITERDKELWHEVTAAFHAQDSETLETVLASLEAGGCFSAVDSLGRLRGILKRLEEKLGETGRQLRREKRKPWWKFGERSKGAGPEAKAQALRAEEERSIKLAECELAELAERMMGWETQASP